MSNSVQNGFKNSVLIINYIPSVTTVIKRVIILKMVMYYDIET